MKTAQEYIDSIKKLKLNAYAMGKKIDCPAEHPLIRPSLNAAAMTYELAQDPQYQDLMTAVSHLTGKRINRFTHLHQSTDDLVKKVKMQRLLGQKTGTCFQRCVGMDAINALGSTTFEIDKAMGTNYHERFNKFLLHLQENDLMCDGAMTDPKGDRGKRPSEQEDPDVFLHVVEKKADGIIVRGAKCHQTGALNSHEILVMPTMAMRQEDADYAVSFAVPTDTPGITYILGRQASDTRKMEGGSIDVGNARFGGQECLVVFDNVFVPWERVFMYKEYKFAGMLVERFAGYHRQSYGGCKVGVGDVLIGAVANLADYQGVANASHIKDKIVEMIHLNETLHACGLACSTEGKPTASGTYLIDLLMANVCKLNVTRFPYEIARIAEDIAGGLMVTLPSEHDYRNPETAHYIEKYLRGISGLATECRLRMLRLVENITIGAAAVAYRTESMHGAGPPQAMRVMIARQANLDEKKQFAKDLAGVTDLEKK
ncbi:4-hydroxybutyryl-CoA dehydratase [Thermanaerosceptrum fracticalcis]|uniref:4-hydroxybutyryl-CoA dehydratase n=1 Tax=Thermanaerosceptrum fracticalcis TaxID=1712410 RepID=A0A7G6E7B2_THEFR|nr:4-hydroxyphenylacetate 3-hydroxylase family protein [Thermanaerosceptrum fracticalcis]QNB47966.1 4-hydroxybutyryl-CoA dehydratase [Thermanaerosceptrum fracticalcis]